MTNRNCKPCQCQGVEPNGLRSIIYKILTTLCLEALLGLSLSNGLLAKFAPNPKEPQPEDFCDDERYLSENYTNLTKAANELFWQAHPELNRRPIVEGENAFAGEWWMYYDRVDLCYKNRNS